MNMIQYEQPDPITFYKHGYDELRFDMSTLLDTFEQLETRTDLTWLTKYPGTVDLRPCPVSIYPELVKILSRLDIPNYIERSLNTSDCTLIHCQVRREIGQGFQATQSYMPMHRDTYFTTNGIVGNCPPVHKLILYPLTKQERDTNVQSSRLRVIKGSHRMMFDRSDMDVSMITQLGKQASTQIISGSDISALLFNTAMLHDVIPCRGSMRIIYSFATQMQYETKYASDDVHRLAHAKYEALR